MSALHPGVIFIDLLRLCAWLVILTAIFVPLERLFAVRAQKIWRPQMLEDLGYYFFNGLVASAVLAIPTAAIVTAVHLVLPQGYFAWVEALPLWLRLIGVFIVGELGFYWGHRWSHENRLLWHFHRTHHEPTQLDWLVNTRAHPFDIIFTRLCGLVPVFAIGLGSTRTSNGALGPILLTLAGTAWTFFIHANLRWRLGWFEQVLSSPRFHHWHHVRVGAINQNYSPMLPVVDRIFGTLHLPAQGWPEHYGIDEQADQRGAEATPLREREA